MNGMKGIKEKPSLWFALAVSSVALLCGLFGGDGLSFVPMLVMLPVMMITVFVSFLINRPTAHWLNMIPVVLCLPLLVVAVMGEQTPLAWIWILGFMGRTFPLLIIGVVVLWLVTLWMGVDEPGSADAVIPPGDPEPPQTARRAPRPAFPTKPLPPGWDR